VNLCLLRFKLQQSTFEIVLVQIARVLSFELREKELSRVLVEADLRHNKII